MLNENDIALVESHLEGKLSGEELDAFLAREQSDPDFAEYIAFRKKIGDAWTTAGDYLQAKQWVKESLEAKTEKSAVGRTRWYALAAIIVILLGVYLIIKFSTQNLDDTPGFASGNNDVELHPGALIDPKTGIDTLDVKPILRGMINGTIYAITDTLAFSWESEKSFENLIISLEENDSIVMRLSLNKNQKSMSLPPASFKSGSYYWYLDKPKVKGYFKIVNE